MAFAFLTWRLKIRLSLNHWWFVIVVIRIEIILPFCNFSDWNWPIWAKLDQTFAAHEKFLQNCAFFHTNSSLMMQQPMVRSSKQLSQYTQDNEIENNVTTSQLMIIVILNALGLVIAIECQDRESMRITVCCYECACAFVWPVANDRVLTNDRMATQLAELCTDVPLIELHPSHCGRTQGIFGPIN